MHKSPDASLHHKNEMRFIGVAARRGREVMVNQDISLSIFYIQYKTLSTRLKARIFSTRRRRGISPFPFTSFPVGICIDIDALVMFEHFSIEETITRLASSPNKIFYPQAISR